METLAVKERPILFSAPMVRAVLDGKKTQTRRIVKPHPPSPEVVKSMCGDTYHWFTDHHSKSPAHFRVAGAVWAVRKLGYPAEIVCPYGAPGDRLWVRETWAATGICFDSLKPSAISPGAAVWYMADGPKPEWAGKTRPAIFMPRWASRIDLEIVSVRVERLNDIREADCIAEGCPPEYLLGVNWYRPLWEKINGDGSWNVNPFVWVIEFRRHDILGNNESGSEV